VGYVSKRGKRPAEYASKSAHSTVINDTSVQDLLKRCDLPKLAGEITLPPEQYQLFHQAEKNPIQYVIAIDGGYTEQMVRTEFPSATVCFFQIGSLFFSIEDLEGLDRQQFIDPEDMAKLKQIQRYKLTLPVRNITLKGEANLTNSVRRVLYDFFCSNPDDYRFIDTLRWFIFKEYMPTPQEEGLIKLGSCPECGNARIPLHRSQMTKDCTFTCPHCATHLFLTDVFRLHEAIDDNLGAGGIFAYVTSAIEQIILVHIIRIILKTKPGLLNQIMFIKDGPLAFFGQTAPMHKPMRALIKFLFAHHNLYLAGLEKSGAFVEHADEIAGKMKQGSFLIVNNDYIYQYIQPGTPDAQKPSGHNTYYGNKLIFKTFDESMYVVTVPTPEVLANPTVQDLRNLAVLLTNIEKLNCDMYDNALLPVALANKLVSLADYPSSKILQKFAIGAIA
jgi:hypothetical protein